jgi:hypothetical protein
VDRTHSGAPSERGEIAGAAEPRGLLHVEFDYPAEQAEELHDWYNSEHVPERLGIAGFVSGRRFAALEGGPRWLAVYETEQPAALSSAEYLHWLGPGETSWTKRILPRNRNVRRTVCELIRVEASEEREPVPGGPPGLFSVRLSGAVDGAGGEAAWGEIGPRSLLGCPGVARARLYRAVADPSDLLLLCELGGVWAVQQPEFRRRWGRITAILDEASMGYSRGLYVRIL